MTMLPNSAPKPRWLISAARPRPAARPAIGPSHERRGAAAGVAAAVGAGAGWAVGAAGRAGSAAGAAGGRLRCMPTAPPPPMRRASATPGNALPAATTKASAKASDLMLSPSRRRTGRPNARAIIRVADHPSPHVRALAFNASASDASALTGAPWLCEGSKLGEAE